MTQLRTDLHMHTAFSDGTLTAEFIRESALKSGVGLVSVTDHDTMAFYENCHLNGLKFVNGVEISAYAGRVKFHTLGYNLDAKKIKPFLDGLFENSFERARDILEKLQKVGVELTWDDLNAQRFSLSTPVHVMHVANAAVAKGYAEKPSKFFNKYLAYGKPAFSCIRRPTPEEAVEAITSAGGFAAVAHPGRITMDGEELRTKIASLKERGLGGIEVYYSTHTDEETEYYKRLAEELGLLPTGGSDTHHPVGGREIGKPTFFASPQLLEKLGID